MKEDLTDCITESKGLTADDVALRRVLCPLCRKKVFKKWTLGRNKHAEKRCQRGKSGEVRKTLIRIIP
jgi:hypothetical protein